MSDIDKQKTIQDSVTSNANRKVAEQKASEPRSDPGSELAGWPHGNLAADAATHLARSGSSFEGFGGNPQEIDRQAASLIDWARQKNLILAGGHTAGLFRHLSTTAESRMLG